MVGQSSEIPSEHQIFFGFSLGLYFRFLMQITVKRYATAE